MSPREFPNLKNYIGQDLILTDGTTLLGGDDKAAIAAVITFAEHLLSHPELPHGPIALGFTPDEEVGGLAKDLDLDRFGAQVAYTLDGGNSAQLVFMGTKINNVKKGGELRRITDIIYFASAWFPEAGDAELEHN